MVIFAIDTSGNQPNAAVAANGKIVASATGASENSTEELAELASRTLALSKLSFDDISEICVSIGPGSFTGIRTGVSFAQGIRQALGIKLFGLDCVTSRFFLTDQMNTPGKSEALLRANSKEFFHRSITTDSNRELADVSDISVVSEQDCESMNNVVFLNKAEIDENSAQGILQAKMHSDFANANLFQELPSEKMLNLRYVKPVHAQTIAERALKRSGQPVTR